MATFTFSMDLTEELAKDSVNTMAGIELTNDKVTDLIIQAGSIDLLAKNCNATIAKILSESLVARKDALSYITSQFPNWPVEKLKNGKLNVCGKDSTTVLEWAKQSETNAIIRRGIVAFTVWCSRNLKNDSWLFLTEDEKAVKKEQAKAKAETKDNRSIKEVVSDSNKALEMAVKTGNLSDAVPGTTGTPVPLKTSILASELLEEEENTVDIPSIIPTTTAQNQGLSDIKILANFYEYAKSSGKYSLDSISDLGIVFENMASELGIETPFV